MPDAPTIATSFASGDLGARDAARAAPVMRMRLAVLRAVLRLRPRRISAMMRVKNEEEFLDAAVRSIVEHVDEVVLVDNQSTDTTPAVIAALRAEYPDKIVCHRYPYEIARVGSETWQLLGTGAVDSPHLSGTYYNWCMQRCSQPYVLKWDGDMIATAQLYAALSAWRRTRVPILVVQGANVHPDRIHLAAARSSDRAALLARQRSPRIPGWVASMAHDFPEPRLFPKLRARYAHAAGFTQSLTSPFLDARCKATLRERVGGISYLHLKFCKAAPYASYSEDLAGVIADNLTTGPRLDAESEGLLERWGIGAASARRT